MAALAAGVMYSCPAQCMSIRAVIHCSHSGSAVPERPRDADVRDLVRVAIDLAKSATFNGRPKTRQLAILYLCVAMPQSMGAYADFLAVDY